MYTLSELADEGHVYGEREQLTEKADDSLGGSCFACAGTAGQDHHLRQGCPPDSLPLNLVILHAHGLFDPLHIQMDVLL